MNSRNQVFKDKPIIGYRRLPNPRQQLTNSVVRYPPPLPVKQANKFTPVCTRLGKCKYCPKLKKIDKFVSFHSGKEFKCQNLPPKAQLTCELYNIST